MGTNYYHREEICPHCDHAKKETHIGKSSGGWSFSFHGTDEIRSYRDWLIALESSGDIRDEYGGKVTLAEFKNIVTNKVGGKNHARSYPSPHEWVDSDGHSFSGGEFS